MQERRLAAVMFTDIVGYTVLMSKDELQAFRMLDINREIHNSTINQFKGVLIKEMGDGILSRFNSAFDAVRCAIEIRKKALTADIHLRIGIHEGDIVFEGNDILGNGVNIASRLEKLAPTDEIYFSEAVNRDIKNKVEIRTEFVKEVALKNVEEAVKIYKISDGKDPRTQSFRLRERFSLKSGIKNLTTPFVIIVIILLVILTIYIRIKHSSDEPFGKSAVASIAIKPFTNLSDDKGNQYFCDGVMEAIAGHLNRIEDIRLVSLASMKKYRDSNLSPGQIAGEVNARYLIDASIYKSQNRILVYVHLIDPAKNEDIWSDQYNRELNDLITLMSDISLKIAEKVKVAVTPDVEENIKSVPTHNPEAYDLYLKANELAAMGGSFSNRPDSAAGLYLQTIALDTNFAEAYIGLAWQMYRKRLTGSPETIWKDSVFTLLNHAIYIKPILPGAYLLKARLYLNLNNREAADENYRAVLHYDPNNSSALFYLARREYLKGNNEYSVALAIKGYLNLFSISQGDSHYLDLADFYNAYGDTLKAKNLCLDYLKTHPNDINVINWLKAIAWNNGNMRDVLQYQLKIDSINNVVHMDSAFDELTPYFYLSTGDYITAEKYYLRLHNTSKNFRNNYFTGTIDHRLGYCMIKNGNVKEGNSLINKEFAELRNAVESGNKLTYLKGEYYDLACIASYSGNLDEAMRYLYMARDNRDKNEGFFELNWLRYDPMLENVRQDERYRKLISEEQVHIITFRKLLRHKIDSIDSRSKLTWLKEN